MRAHASEETCFRPREKEHEAVLAAAANRRPPLLRNGNRIHTHTQTLLVSRENARRAPRLLRRGAALAPKIQDLCALLYDRNKCKYTIRICTMVGSAPLGDVLDRRASICRGYAL
jgi:hypothetical protein